MHKTTFDIARRRSVQRRKPSSPRKVYLDSYTKKRVEETFSGDETIYNPTQPPVATPVMVQPSTPVQQPQPSASPVAVSSNTGFSSNQVPLKGSTNFTPTNNPVIAGSQPSVSAPSLNVQPTVYNPASEPRQFKYSPAQIKNYVTNLIAKNSEAIKNKNALKQFAEEEQKNQFVINDDQTLEQPLDLFESTQQEKKIEAKLDSLYSGSLTDMIAKNSDSASSSHVRTIVASALACGILAVGIFSFFSKYDPEPVQAQPIGASVIEVESSNAPQQPAPSQNNNASGPVAADPSHPVKLIISSIGVNAPVQGLGTTAQGNIDVPKAYGVAGWYNKGSVPGKPGPAVLVGHFTAGRGGVFDKLNNLVNDDLITVTNGRGQSFTYKVVKKAEYNKDQVPMQELFKSSDDSRLEIITCSGNWLNDNDTYSNRLVVTAEIVR